MLINMQLCEALRLGFFVQAIYTLAGALNFLGFDAMIA